MSTKVQQAITIDQPVEKVFAFLTDTRNITRWQPGLLESRATPEGLAQVGTQVTDVRTFLGRKLESVYEITALEPNRRMSIKSISGPFPYQGDYLFEPEGSAASKLTFNAEIEPRGFFKVAEGVMAGALRKEMEVQLSTVKQVLESEA